MSRTIGGQPFLELSISTLGHVPFKGISLDIQTDAALRVSSNPYEFIGVGLYPFVSGSTAVFKAAPGTWNAWTMVVNEHPAAYVGFRWAASHSIAQPSPVTRAQPTPVERASDARRARA